MEMALFEGRVVCISLTRTGPIIDTIESKFEQKMTLNHHLKKKVTREHPVDRCQTIHILSLIKENFYHLLNKVFYTKYFTVKKMYDSFFIFQGGVGLDHP